VVGIKGGRPIETLIYYIDYVSTMTQVIDKVSIKDTYETKQGSKKTRTLTIRSMTNEGSLFANLHLGRGSVNLPKVLVPKACKALLALSWETSDSDDTIKALKAKIAELEKARK